MRPLRQALVAVLWVALITLAVGAWNAPTAAEAAHRLGPLKYEDITVIVGTGMSR
jgi:hypothetical protein